MLLDPATWKTFWDLLFTKGREDPQKWFNTWNQSWEAPRPTLDQVREMLSSSFTQDQYHVIPVGLLLDSVRHEIEPPLSTARTFLIKNIVRTEKRARLRVPTDNQAFWGILSDFIGKTQVRGTAELRLNKKIYEITDIPANTISEESLVFEQEIGTARTICQAMLDVFGDDYIDLEFSNRNRKPILDSVFLGRGIKVSMVAKNYEKRFGETDFDYKIDLSPLSKRYPNLDSKILLDLTAGLWNKSIAKDKDEFLAQWEHNLIKLPEMNSGLYTFWHYGLKSEIKDGTCCGTARRILPETLRARKRWLLG
jgi:hypothetical protein